MKNIILFTAVLMLTLFSACKKKESTPDTTNTTTTTGSTTTGGTTSGGSYSNLQTTYLILNVGGVIAKDSSIIANFYSTPLSSASYSLVSAGTVSLNSVNIPTISGISYYIGNSAPVNLAGLLTWNVSGSGTLTAFSHSFVPSYPKYSGGNLLPDTCSKSAGITLTVTGVTNNVDNTLLVQLYGTSGSANASALKVNLGSNGIITFTPQDLASFPINATLTILISWSNITNATYGGIKHSFANNLQYVKLGYLKP